MLEKYERSSECKCLLVPLYLGRGENERANPPPAPISKEKGILQRLKEVFWKPEEEEPDGEGGESNEGQRQKMS